MIFFSFGQNNRVLEMASDFPNTGNVAVCAPTSMGHNPGKYPWVFYIPSLFTPHLLTSFSDLRY